ncbi:hypothetical protein [Candidatus Uabimicrobium sp. HlEnr_7]|uniref:hypothetical protein n=1 Tax=Candidatus Uabimicrobium helgolandensis TaxID=3095367 RepID=UPI003558F633
MDKNYLQGIMTGVVSGIVLYVVFIYRQYFVFLDFTTGNDFREPLLSLFAIIWGGIGILLGVLSIVYAKYNTHKKFPSPLWILSATIILSLVIIILEFFANPETIIARRQEESKKKLQFISLRLVRVEKYKIVKKI